MNRYSQLSMTLHWLMALLIVIAFSMGVYMTDLPFGMSKLKLYAWHKWLGVSILGLVAIRLLYRLRHPAPAFPSSLPLWERQAAALTHIALYGLMFAVPISGYLYTYAAGFPVVYLGLWELPAPFDPNPDWKTPLKTLHEVLNTLLLLLVSLHFVAALKHRFIDKDDILDRMLPARFKGGGK